MKNKDYAIETTETNVVKEMPAGTAYDITVTKDGREYHAYLKEADKATISLAMSKMRNVNKDNFDMIEIGELILRKCFLGGDVEIITEDKLLISASIQAYELIEIYDSTIKKI